MASAWGKAWGGAWGDSWGLISVAVVVSKPGGSVSLRQGLTNSTQKADALAEQLRREDEEIIAVVVAAFNVGIIP